MTRAGLLSGFVLLLVITTITCVRIQCNFYDNSWVVIGSNYQCSGTIIDVENPTLITDVIGTHLAGRTHADVKSFSVFNHQILNAIPSGIENFFPNLEGLEWFQGNITTIHSSIFKPFPNILVFSLERNNLVTIDGDLFQYTRSVRWIYFGSNMLANVGHNLMTGLTNLTEAYFNSNPCISASASTAQQVQELNLRLPIACPPLATTTAPSTTTTPTTSSDPATTTISTTTESNDCPSTCTLYDESRRHSDESDKMMEIIIEMQKQIVELQKQVIELNSNPCSCKAHQ